MILLCQYILLETILSKQGLVSVPVPVPLLGCHVMSVGGRLMMMILLCSYLGIQRVIRRIPC